MFLPLSNTDRHAFRMSRRDALGVAAGLGLTSVLGARIGWADEAASSAGDYTYRIGCSGRSFHKLLPTKGKPGSMTLVDFVRRCGEWRCDCLELLDVSFISGDQAELQAIKREAFLSAVELSALSVYTDFIRPERKLLEKEVQRLRGWVDRTATLGAPLLVIFPGKKKRGVSLDHSIELVSRGLTRLAAYAAERGVLLGLENHGMFVNNASSVLKVVSNVGSEWLGVNLDTGNFRKDVYQNISALAPHAINCHLKLDVFSGKKKAPADLDRKFAILRENNYRGRIVLQYELKGDPLHDVPAALSKMRRLAKPIST